MFWTYLVGVVIAALIVSVVIDKFCEARLHPASKKLLYRVVGLLCNAALLAALAPAWWAFVLLGIPLAFGFLSIPSLYRTYRIRPKYQSA
jgi:hypothetical protein